MPSALVPVMIMRFRSGKEQGQVTNPLPPPKRRLTLWSAIHHIAGRSRDQEHRACVAHESDLRMKATLQVIHNQGLLPTSASPASQTSCPEVLACACAGRAGWAGACVRGGVTIVRVYYCGSERLGSLIRSAESRLGMCIDAVSLGQRRRCHLVRGDNETIHNDTC